MLCQRLPVLEARNPYSSAIAYCGNPTCHWRTAPYRLRDCVDHESQVFFASPQAIFDSPELDHFLGKRLVDRFKFSGALDGGSTDFD
jgi:hypothetical protein